MSPSASKMTPEPVAAPWPPRPVIGSVEVMPSATMVTTAGLTALTTPTTEPSSTGAGVAGVGATLPPGAGATSPPGAGEAPSIDPMPVSEAGASDEPSPPTVSAA